MKVKINEVLASPQGGTHGDDEWIWSAGVITTLAQIVIAARDVSEIQAGLSWEESSARWERLDELLAKVDFND